MPARLVVPAPRQLSIPRLLSVIPPEPVKPHRPELQLPDQVPLPALPESLPVTASLSVPDLPARMPAAVPVKTGVFGSPEAPSGHAVVPRSEVRTAGFGDANGAGAGSRAANLHPALVAAAGFGNIAVQNQPSRRAEAAAVETPVEVVWKPKPLYTEEAKARKLEGNVTLEVVFRATGEVKVIRVVRGLGSGLDESARSAAEQIRFRPGQRDGVPVDRTGLVQITFELS
jgi:TonB family protein